MKVIFVPIAIFVFVSASGIASSSVDATGQLRHRRGVCDSQWRGRERQFGCVLRAGHLGGRRGCPGPNTLREQRTRTGRQRTRKHSFGWQRDKGQGDRTISSGPACGENSSIRDPLASNGARRVRGEEMSMPRS